MNPTRQSLLTLSAALLLGAVLGIAFPVEAPTSSAPTPAPAGDIPSTAADTTWPASRAPGKSARVHPDASSSAGAYAAAWDLLQDRDLPGKERRPLEYALIEEWSRVDLRAALHVAFAVPGTTGWQVYFGALPHTACIEQIGLQQDLVWDLVTSREYGLNSRELRTAWMRACAARRPLDLLRRLPQLPDDVRADAIGLAVENTHRESPVPGKQEVIASILALRGTPDEALALAGYAEGLSEAMTADELVALIADPPEPALRGAYLAACVEKLRGRISREMRAKLDSLPPDLRAELEAAMKARNEETGHSSPLRHPGHAPSSAGDRPSLLSPCPAALSRIDFPPHPAGMFVSWEKAKPW